MKTAARFFGIALAIVIIVFSAIVSQAAYVMYVTGDANGDEVISIKDVTTIQRVIAQFQDDPNGSIAIRASVTSKGSLSINDATAIQEYLAEYENTYKIGTTFYFDPYELPVIF